MVLFGKGGGRENFLMGPRHFSPGPTQNLFLQNGEKTEWGEFDSEMTKLPMYIAHGQSPVGYFFFLMVSWVRTLPPLFFLLISRAWHFVCVCVFFFV